MSRRIYQNCDKVFTIEDDGLITAGDTVDYASLVQNDNDIPNKAYLDSYGLGSGYSGYSGTSGISGYSGDNPGTSGWSGTSGTSGWSGESGWSGAGESGYSGWSGEAGGGGGTTATYLYLTMSANQTTGIADTNPIKFDTHVGDIDFDNATYRATLLAGVTYELVGMAMTEFSGTTGYTYMIWYDVTNSAQLGTKAISAPFTYYGTAISNQPNFAAVVTPVTDIVVEARLDTPTLLTVIHKNYTCGIIKSI